MAIEITVPTLGESVADATVARWIKTTGDAVAADEPVVELETDKVTLEVPAPAAGTQGNPRGGGATVEVGASLAMLNEGAAPSAPAAPARTGLGSRRRRPPSSTGAPAAASAAPDMPLSPAVRRLVEENNLPGRYQGHGVDGRLTKADILAHMSAPAHRPRQRQQQMPPSRVPKTPPASACRCRSCARSSPRA